MLTPGILVTFPCRRYLYTDWLFGSRAGVPGTPGVDLAGSNFFPMFISSEIHALIQVIIVDLVLAGDNAIVVGMVAASMPVETRKKVIFFGIFMATIMRIAFSFGALELLEITGLIFAGGLLLLWVAWKLWREIQHARSVAKNDAAETIGVAQPKTFMGAAFQIVMADLSMSLDNVLAVAGAARHHTWVLIVGLCLSIGLMAWASTYIAELLKRYHWIAYIGLSVIFFIAGSMIWEGAQQVYGEVLPR
ncbi:MAG: TerC family protein [Halioglobus sp.]